MANDFRANQVRLNKIISSGSIPILIYPSSSAADFQGGLTNFSTTAVGTDVFLYVSGAVGARGGGSPKISVFGGDLHVSGNFTVDGTAPGGPSFFTEIGFEQIETTGSVAMTYLSSSTGAEITGSFKISGSSVVFDYNGLFPNEITLQNTNTGDELYLTTSSLGYINGITPDKFLITSDGVLEISSNVSRISLNSNSEITGSLDVLGEINVYSGSIVPGFVIQPNTDGTGSIDILYDKDLSGISIINMRPLYVTMSTDSNSGILLSGSLLTSKLTTSTIGKIDFNILAIAPTTDDYASWLFSTTVVQDSTNTVKLLVASELDSIFSGSNATTWDVNINSNGDVYCTGSNAATVHWYAQVTKKMVLSGSSVIVY